MPATVNSSDGSSLTSEAEGTTVWPRFAKKSSQRRWISAVCMGSGRSRCWRGRRSERASVALRWPSGARPRAGGSRRRRPRRSRAPSGRCSLKNSRPLAVSLTWWATAKPMADADEQPQETLHADPPSLDDATARTPGARGSSLVRSSRRPFREAASSRRLEEPNPPAARNAARAAALNPASLISGPPTVAAKSATSDGDVAGHLRDVLRDRRRPGRAACSPPAASSPSRRGSA